MFKKQLIAITCSFSWMGFAQLSSVEIDQLVERTLTEFNVPGIAVGVIKDGELIHAKGYGLANINTKTRVDANTLFGIASNSKAFCAATLALLVDEGKLDWDDKVVKYLPDFKMYNDYVTNEFTIRDLLTHRSGLGLGAGDLMIWPQGNDFTEADIIHNLRYLKPVSAFRTKYDYDNLLYIVAGEVVKVVSGKSWQAFTEERLLKPVGMKNSAASFNRLADTSNVIAPHVPIDGKLKVIERYTQNTFDAAAGIYSSVNDMAEWAKILLNKGKKADGTVIIPEKQLAEMWTPQTLMPARATPPYNSHFQAYGLGWNLSVVAGRKQVMHTGGLEGIVTQFLLIPEENLGIIVLTNQQVGAAFVAISNSIKDGYLGLPATDHVGNYKKRLAQMETEADLTTAEVWKTVEGNYKKRKALPDAQKHLGTYQDPWFGEVTLSWKDNQLYFTSQRSSQLKGKVYFYKDNNYVVKWENRYLHADAHIFFNEQNGFTMLPISPLTDFSYDFQDLEFTRQ